MLLSDRLHCTCGQSETTLIEVQLGIYGYAVDECLIHALAVAAGVRPQLHFRLGFNDANLKTRIGISAVTFPIHRYEYTGVNMTASGQTISLFPLIPLSPL